MKRKTNYLRRIIKIALTIIMICLVLPLLTYAIPNGLNPAKTKKYFSKKHINYKDTIIEFGERKIRFVSSGNDTLPMLLFIHGSPGSWDAFKSYLADSSLRSKAFLVSVDRPGYGESGHLGIATLQEQAECLSAVLQLRKNDQPITLVGHSYGGPVAIKFALQNTSLIKQIILISPVISPEIQENISWIRNLQKMSKWWIWSWAISRDLKNSTIEMQPLPNELRIMEKDYSDFRLPILEIHGTKDPLAPIGNQSYVKNTFKNSVVDSITLKGKNHFIPWTMTDKMISYILEKL